MVQKNRVQIHMVTKEQARDQAKSKRWEYEVNEFNEQKAERKLKPKYAYPNAKQQQQYQERKEKGTRSSSLTRSSSHKVALMIAIATLLCYVWLNSPTASPSASLPPLAELH